jgi:hypothetical protein
MDALQSPAELERRWAELKSRKQSGGSERSLEQLVRLLRVDPEFATVNRATLSRWAKGIGDALRIRRALELLERISASSPAVRIGGLHPAAEGLPLWLLDPDQSRDTRTIWSHVERANSYKIGDKYEINAEMHWFQNGGDALADLADGKVDIAMASREYAKSDRIPKVIRRLCAICELPIGVITQNKVDGLWMLKDVTIGVQAGTAIPQLVSNQLRLWNVVGARPREIRPEENRVELFKTAAVGALVGTPLWLKEAYIELREKGMTPDYQSASPFFGTTELDLFVRVDTVNPAAVRTLLRALTESVAFINEQKDSASFQQTVRALMKPATLKEVAEMLKNYIFCIEKLDIETTIQLWAAEVRRESEKSVRVNRPKTMKENGRQV